MSTRTGQIGDCYEFSADGCRLAGKDRMTIDQMISFSADWPGTIHQYVGPDDYVTWAQAGSEIPEPSFPAAQYEARRTSVGARGPATARSQPK